MNFITQNGQLEIAINEAPTRDACKLKNVVWKALIDSKILKENGTLNLTDTDINGLLPQAIQALITLDSSDEFQNAVFECLKVCICDPSGVPKKITMTLFDDMPSIREDYYEIIAKCCEVNLRPFFKSLVSAFSTQLKSLGKENPAQE